MVAPFLEGYIFKDLGLDGGPYDELAHPKGLIHTTQGTSVAGAESAFRPYPPHALYHPINRTKMQYIRLDRHSYSLRGAESDDELVFQIEIVGYAEETHLWSDQIYRNIAEDVIIPFRNATGIPDNFLRFYRAGEDGIVLASPNSPIRLSNSAFRNFAGWCGHQHAPDPDEHWDPGGFLMDKAIAYSRVGEIMSYLDELVPNTNEDNGERLARRMESIFYNTTQTGGDLTESNKLAAAINAIKADVVAVKAAQSAIASDVTAIKTMLANALGVGQELKLTAQDVITVKLEPVQP